MDNLRAVIKNLFCHINPWVIINNDNFYCKITEDIFMELGTSYIRRYSNDELRNMYQFMKNEYAWHNRKLIGSDCRPKHEEYLNVYDTLSTFNYAVLTEENLEPKCTYVNLLRWREMITSLEEDLFVTSFLAQNDLFRGKKRNNFFWKIVIGHNNYALNRMLEQGVAENHFHLKGSAPMFHLSWINLMNYPESDIFEEKLNDYNRTRLQKNMENNVEAGVMSYALMWRKAAAIRLFLFSYLVEDYLDIPNASVRWDEIHGLCNEAERKNIMAALGVQSMDRINLSDHESIIAEQVGFPTYVRIKRYISKKWIMKVLADSDFREDDLALLRQNIDRLKENHRGSKDDYLYDYTLGKHFVTRNPDHAISEVICGERWLMYSMFRVAYEESGREGFVNNIFYAYLVMKTRLRDEIIQANMGVGFDNFLRYQDRKENFIDDTPLEKVYLKMAVRDTIYSQPIRFLEARITPRNTPAELQSVVKKYDKFICDGLSKEEQDKLKDKFFYVLHFIKEADDVEDYLGVECRHHAKRESIKYQALSLAAIREEECEEAKRIMGIDASSSEIPCRPEVFAHAFRFLKNHTPEFFFRKPGITCPKLMSTYHVGEDFLDIVDGLRAIDEAIAFLNLNCGDRLGHALALGVDPDEWYQSKAHRVLISKQAYLDNLSWLYAKIRKYGITDSLDVQNYIMKKISILLQEIYLNFISAADCEEISRNAADYARKRNFSVGQIFKGLTPDYNHYYDSMKLRGDDPELYREGFFKNPFANIDEWDAFAVNSAYPDNYQIRYNPAVAYLYYMYHFDPNVRRVGNEMIEIKVNPQVIKVIKQVQYHMQLDISHLGIGIETNPSSNYFIGTFRRFDKHPIVAWYNNGLVHDQKLLECCPQIQVSINTDDQGVFATYIENEFAYLSLALEKCKDENGNRIYNRTMILQWLDNIRKMGISQSFRQKE